MYTIFKKEINSFLSSLIGYIVICVFLLTTGLFLWVFPDTNILDHGYANLDTLFVTAPWIFMFLAPAITMGLFSEETKSGTIEIITTRPISDLKIVLGKYFAGVALLIVSLLPTLLYYYTVYQLGSPIGNLDSGAIGGSYIGLVFLGGSFVAIGIFTSSITENQIVSFILSVFVCFFCFIGFESISSLHLLGDIDNLIELTGINAHYLSISRGVLDTRDLIYFLGFISIFILFTKTALGSRKW